MWNVYTTEKIKEANKTSEMCTQLKGTKKPTYNMKCVHNWKDQTSQQKSEMST